jgi:sugar phosphate isomerase/epimerase
MFRLAYNTNGLAHHRVVDALRLVAELGYEGLSITPDVGQLDPFRLDSAEVREVRRVANDLGLALSIETGARYLMDPARKHAPTLLAASATQRERRVDMLRRCIDLAAELDAAVVSLWSGSAPSGARSDGAATGHLADATSGTASGASPRSGERGASTCEAEWQRLCEGLSTVLRHARVREVRVAFEPEPGMFVERPAGFDELRRRLGSSGDELGLCLDVGHCLCTGDLPVSKTIERYAGVLLQVHLDDIRAGAHEHLMFGRGDLDLADALGALLQTNYTGLAAVELSRDSHRGAEAAREALFHLQAALARISPRARTDGLI